MPTGGGRPRRRSPRRAERLERRSRGLDLLERERSLLDGLAGVPRAHVGDLRPGRTSRTARGNRHDHSGREHEGGKRPMLLVSFCPPEKVDVPQSHGTPNMTPWCRAHGTIQNMRGVAGLVFLVLLVVPQLAVATTGPAPDTGADGRRPRPAHDRRPRIRGEPRRHDRRADAGGIERRTLRAGDLGRFRLELPAVSLTGRLRCGAGVVIAARTKGGELVLWHQVLPNCPMPLRPPST